MGRSKKTNDELENLEPELEEAMEAEALEAADGDTEAEEEVAEEKPARKPRARKPRKQAEPKSLLGAMSKPVAEEKEETESETEEQELDLSSESEEVIAEPVEEKKTAPRRKRATAAEKAEAAEVEEVAKPWAAVKDISATISANLEKVNQQLREIPQQELFRPPVARPAGITKVAVGMSFFAIVLSITSLLLSQQARQVALEQIASPAAVVQSVPTAPGAPQQLALESIRRKPQRAKKTR